MRTRIYRMNIYYKRELNSFIKTDFIPQNVPQNRVFCKKNGRFSIQICKKYGIYALFLCINAVFWSRRRDLNPRPSRPERDALPAALRLDFFKFLSIFVSGQTCGQATYFERFIEKCTARIVRFFKGFSDFQKSLLQDRWRCPERCALPAALRLDCLFRSSDKRNHYNR